jgi:hypothetical protein
MITTKLMFELKSPTEALELAELFEDYQDSHPLLKQPAKDLRDLWRLYQPVPGQLQLLDVINNPPAIK